MSECTCGSGAFSGSCCCGSVTNIKGGIHPDSILSVSKDLVLDQSALVARTHFSAILLNEAVHVVGIEASLISVRRDQDVADLDKQLQEPASNAQSNIASASPASVSLYTAPGFALLDLDIGGFNPLDASQQDKRFFCTASLTNRQPTWTASPDLFGFFCDGGVFVEFNAPTNGYGIRLVMRYVPRLQFSPAYHDPLAVMQHYWKCSRGDTEFLEGFYGGTSLQVSSLVTGGTTQAQSSGQGSRFTSVDTSFASDTPSIWF